MIKPKMIFWLYIIVSTANLVAQAIPSEELNRYTKPLLMPLMLLYVYRESIGNTTKTVLLLSVAILFSWLGDVVLMFQSTELYFMLGIGLFLIAQVTYVVVLRQATSQGVKVGLARILPFLVYGVLLFYILLPAGAFTVPIIVYGLVLLLMMIMAYARKGSTSPKSFRLAFAGSVLFVLSDSILAINAFKTPLPYAGLLIMSTYCAAQYLLAKGILAHDG